MEGGDGGLEPPDDWLPGTLDEDFVRAAPVAEASADDRRRAAEARRRSAELQAARGDDAYRDRQTRAQRARLASQRRLIWCVAAIGVAVGIVAVSRPSPQNASTFGPDAVRTVSLPAEARPSAPVAESDHPLGTPAALARSDPHFSFIDHQPGSSAPVAYDPCRPIHYVVNATNAPTAGPGLLARAVARLHRATGLDFVDDGPTTEPPTPRRAPFQPNRYGDRWAPVVIWWTDPAHYPALGGGVVGVGGSTAETLATTGAPVVSVYVSGLVALDGPQVADLVASTSNGAALAEAVILHELGHLVGLDHVTDRREIMQPALNPSVTDYGPGDLTGLQRLGRGRCVPAV